jgi:hypothetical protein
MNRIINYVRGCVVLHNYLIDDEVDENWMEEGNDCLDDLAPETASTATNTPDYTRRDELYYYLSELDETAIN